ncbi:MAG: hypothetical protein Q4C82_09630 [Eubacteriales bacterium]|nr:hypothetical protein [Eubacteriales bacterium]
MTGADDRLRRLLFQSFRVGKVKMDVLEALLAACITAVGFALRTAFPDSGVPGWEMLLAEWYLAVSCGILTFRLTGNGRRGLFVYGILMILPTVIMDGTIMGGSSCVGALLCVSALLLLESGHVWCFTAVSAALLLWDVRYAGLFAACAVLWQWRRIRSEQFLILLAAAAARFVYSYRIWLGADYTLTTFHWPNIYEIVGREAMQGQLFDPVATVGLFVAVGLLLLGMWALAQGESFGRPGRAELELLLFFGLAAGYFLPYMDQTYGYLFCALAVVWAAADLRCFPAPALLQIAAFAGYQECVNGESMMPMWVFSVLQLLILTGLAVRLLKEAKVVDLCARKN